MAGEYYDRLGVSSDASTDEIAAAYRERLKETHPDVSDATDAGERTKRLIEAKAVLTDERERDRYDRLGHDRYIRIEKGRTPEPEGTPEEGDEQGESDAGETSSTGADSRTSARETAGTDTASGSESTNDGGAGGHGTRDRRGFDWGKSTAGEGRGRHSDGINWEERSETDWDAVSDAVWEDVTGEDSGQSPHTETDWGDASDTGGATAESTADDRATSTRGGRSTRHTDSGEDDESGWNATWSAGRGRADSSDHQSKADSTTSRSAGTTGTTDAGGGPAGVGAGEEATTATGTVSGGAETGETSTRTSSAGTADRGDWTVGWYSGGDPSGTSHEAYSFGGSDPHSGSWSNWSLGTEHDSRYSRRTFPPHRVLSPIQTVVLFSLCFATYPLLVTGAVFPVFAAPVRILLAMFLVFVVATLIILSQLGVAVFGAWTILFPIAFEYVGVSLFTEASVVTMGAVLVSLGLAVLSRLVIRPPAL